MKKLALLFTLLILLAASYAQNVGIGTTNPDNSAQLDIVSNSRGLLVPRMTTAERTAIASPAKGLMVFDTETNGFWFYNGSSWTNMNSVINAWSLTGNAGTDPNANFIGTTDDQPLKLRVNNQPAGIIGSASTGNTGIGSNALGNGGKYNTAVGYNSLIYPSDSNNTTLGAYSNVAYTHFWRASNATAVGAYSFAACRNCVVLGSVAEQDGATVNAHVGIGTSTPRDALEIQAPRNGENRLIFSKYLSTNYISIRNYISTEPNNCELNFFVNRSNGFLNTFNIYGNGDAYLAGTLFQNSDFNLKEKVRPIENALNSLRSITGYCYQWKDKYRGSNVQIGLIAQEVQEFFPELIRKDQSGLLSVNYTGLIPVTIQAIKEQQTKIESLEQRIEKLEHLINNNITSNK